MASPAAKLRQLLADESKIIVCPGVFDGLTARIAIQAGFDAIYMVSMNSYSFKNIMEDSLTLIDGCWNSCFQARNARPGSAHSE